MARPAPSVERTVKLLKFLADHPRERFSLSDIARRLEFNKATCHAMLTELVNEGMLIRHPSEKTYLLGPALVNLGTAATLDAAEALDIAKVEMSAIHEELNVSCVATALVGRDIVVMARRDVQRPLFGHLPVGNRSPLQAPYGAEFMAWAPEAEVETWLDHHEPNLSQDQRDAYFTFLDRIRLTGYQATSFEQVMALRRILELLRGLPGAAELEQAIQERADQVYVEAVPPRDFAAVTAIKAPVFGPSGRVVLALSIAQFDVDASRDEIAAGAERLLEGTRRVTAALHGSEPFPHWARPVDAGGRLRSDLPDKLPELSPISNSAEAPPSRPAAARTRELRSRSTKTGTRTTRSRSTAV
ncbi:IclR family transcriptional regulator [Nocardia sp. NPDC052278]|uniref:IclR family transcriptional regulator n=1 Tax=unclassified Nocardia TaxID=2637762 RepID=UPI0036BC24E8